MINADLALLLLAAIAFIGFVLDALFEKVRVSSILPLMLLGVALVHFGLVPPDTLALLDSVIPFVVALTIAFILFSVGLDIRVTDLARVVGRATGFTFVVQTATGIALAFVAYAAFHWEPLICFVFGFGLSGPSSVAVPILVRTARMSPDLKTTLLFESVLSDVLQLIVPLTLIGLVVSGNLHPEALAESLLLTVVGSAVAGIALGLAWLLVLDRLRDFAAGYYWTLTIMMVLATYGIADLIGLSAAITIFVFGLTIGNALLFDTARQSGATARPGVLARSVERLRSALGMSTSTLQVDQIQQVHKEVAFFASSFFFVYLGILFQTTSVGPGLLAATIAVAVVMLAVRFVALPLLAPFYSTEPGARRSERALVAFNISRGLAAAVIATIPLSYGLVIPGFLDAMFLSILFSTVVSTVGIFVYYHPGRSSPAPSDGTAA